jgi:hypothetical protein
MSSSYISAFSSAKWEDWHDNWVIAMIDANDRLELPMEGPLLDRSSWKARPSLPVELDVHNGARRLPEAPHCSPTTAIQDGLHVHRGEQLQ